ncbi:MAG: cytidylate kinase-like family protein [Bacteroidales bacterium]|nr:cytidylate kinase-like family protein [Bacteroidales bacterium]
MDLAGYLNSRLVLSELSKPGHQPFITISRETGCGVTAIARLLIAELKKRGLIWKYIDKDVLFEASKKLRLNESKINYVFEAERKTHVDEIISALSNRYYKSDKTVRRTISEVVKHYAGEGNVIIVGRGGVAITAGMDKGFHVKLVAPESWRIQSLMALKNKPYEEIKTFVKENDRKRQQLLSDFCKTPAAEFCYDLILNRASYTEKQIAEIILEIMQKQGLI